MAATPPMSAGLGVADSKFLRPSPDSKVARHDNHHDNNTDNVEDIHRFSFHRTGGTEAKGHVRGVYASVTAFGGDCYL